MNRYDGALHGIHVDEGKRNIDSLLCVASTGTAFCHTVDQSHPGWATSVYGPVGKPKEANNESNCFRYAQLSADGSTVVTYNEDLVQRTFAVPPVNSSKNPLTISPHCSAPSPLKLGAFALYNGFDITNGATTLVLNSQFDMPLRLTNALDLGYTHATYKWQNSMTEAYIAPISLIFAQNGIHFVAGARESIAIFDINKSGEDPLNTYPTRVGRKARKLYGTHDIGLAGLVTSLAISANDSTLAAGTTGRQIGLFANAGSGECITSFSLQPNDAEDAVMKGNGATQIEWSNCGQYLFIAERQSDAILVYDVRYACQRVAYLTGRHALTTQRLSFDKVVASDGSVDIWAGGTDGRVRVWRNVTSNQGPIEPDVELHTSNATISNTILRDSLLVTTSGQRRPPSELLGWDVDDGSSTSDSDSDSDSDTSGSGGGDNNKGGDVAGDRDMNTAEESWLGPTFDNVLGFWEIL